MPLNQAGLAVIARDNYKYNRFIAIKRIKKLDLKPVYRISDFTSNHIVNIKDIFLNDDEVVIIYK